MLNKDEDMLDFSLFIMAVFSFNNYKNKDI